MLFGCDSRSVPRDTVVAANVAGPVIEIENGTTAVDLLGDATKAQVVVGWRGNYNAHGYSTAAFLVFTKGDIAAAGDVWQIIPFFGGEHDAASGEEIFRTTEGADCTLRDLRVLRHAGASVEVVIANRAPGLSFADSAAVQFDYYTLLRGDGSAGTPPFRFQHVRSVTAKRAYCDVNEAFRAELSLSGNGLARSEGDR